MSGEGAKRSRTGLVIAAAVGVPLLSCTCLCGWGWHWANTVPTHEHQEWTIDVEQDGQSGRGTVSGAGPCEAPTAPEATRSREEAQQRACDRACANPTTRNCWGRCMATTTTEACRSFEHSHPGAKTRWDDFWYIPIPVH